MSLIPLIVLLSILFVGCVYYLWSCRANLIGAFEALIKGKKTSSDLKNKSLKELEELLSTNRSREHFEKCAEIRDEIESRTD